MCVLNRKTFNKSTFSQERDYYVSPLAGIIRQSFARKFFVGNLILKQCVATKGRKKPFEFSFLPISQNLCILMKNFSRTFFVEKLNFEQMCHHQGTEKNLSNAFVGK